MGEARTEAWSLAEFLAFEREQEWRYEFVDGRAVVMAGGARAHALIAPDLIASLRPVLRGSPRLPSGSDLRVPVSATGHSRYPDVTIDRGPLDPDAHDASEPTAVFEVLSKSTGRDDQTRKVRDCGGVATIRRHVCISQSEPRVSIWLRDGAGTRLIEPTPVSAV